MKTLCRDLGILVHTDLKLSMNIHEIVNSSKESKKDCLNCIITVMLNG